MSVALEAVHTQLLTVDWADAPQRVYAAVEFAERSEMPWGAWRRGNQMFLIVGGELNAYDPLSLLSPPTEISTDKLDEPNAIEIAAAVPSRIISRRFSSRSETQLNSSEDVWSGWGEGGLLWVPAFSLCFDLSKSLGVIAYCAQLDNDDSISSLFTVIKQPQPILRGEPPPLASLSPLESLEAYPSWRTRVEEVKRRCHQGELSKVVFARSWTKNAPDGYQWSGARMWRKCLERAAHGEIPFALSPRQGQCFVGVSPERLFEIKDRRLNTHALAGTRALSDPSDSVETERLFKDLTSSSKDREEHEIVVSLIEEALSETCVEVNIGDRRLSRAGSLVHLETPIEATLRQEVSPQVMMERLHPTPALGGAPRADALALIKETEPMQRGAYAAPWMWESAGGEACAVVGIRSALLSPQEVRVFAGAGIVGRSDPQSEWLETRAKACVIDSLLGGDVLKRSKGLSEDSASENSVLENAVLGHAASEGSVACRQQRRCLLMVSAMKRAGIVGAVLSPGSRNTPLALALDKLLPCLVSVDERSAGFIALGWAKSSGLPIALCCTSGSAAAHYLPALIEARYSSIPLLVLSADRPPRLRGRGAPQTIEQLNLFGTYCKRSLELRCDNLSDPLIEEAQRIVDAQRIEDASDEESLTLHWLRGAVSSVEESLRAPRGATHLNLPFEEPLWNRESEALLEGWTEESNTRREPVEIGLEVPTIDIGLRSEGGRLFLNQLHQSRGVIYCGPLSPQAAKLLSSPISQLSALTGWPIFAEASSQLRGRISTIRCLDQLIKGGERDIPRGTEVQVVLAIGGHTHSRAIRAWLEESRLAAQLWLGEGPEVVDPLALSVKSLGASLSIGVEVIAEGIRLLQNRESREDGVKGTLSAWATRWRDLESRRESAWARSELQQSRTCSDVLLWGGAVGEILCDQLDRLRREEICQGSADVVIASSMAFRDHDMTWDPLPMNSLKRREGSVEEPPAQCWVNRGANGIDGTLSTALGIALGQSDQQPTAPLVVWLGDLAAHHDLQGLHRLSRWARESGSRSVIVLLTNNEGGGDLSLVTH